MDWVLVAEVATGFTSVASLLFVAWQLKALTRQTRSSTNALQAAASMHTFTSAIEIDRFFADRPELRRLFYGDLSGGTDELRQQSVDAVSKLLLDQFMLAAIQMDHMSPDLRIGGRVGRPYTG